MNEKLTNARDFVYNLHTDVEGVRVARLKDDEYADVITNTTPPEEVTWHRSVVISSWYWLPQKCASFIRERMHPIYAACITLGMNTSARRVRDFVWELCEGQGEGYTQALLDCYRGMCDPSPVSKVVCNEIGVFLDELA